MKGSTDKPSKWKFLTVLIPSVLAAYATIVSTWIQTTGAKESSIKVLVSQINEQIIPHMQELVDELIKENTLLRERVAKMEGIMEAKREIADRRASHREDKKEEPKKEHKRFPHIPIQRVLE